MATVKSIAVLLADDHTIVREGLRLLLDAEDDIEVVGEAATGGQAVNMAGELRPDVIVMDIAMPQLNGLEATRQIRRANPDIKVLVLSAHSDDAYIKKMTELGASGYLIKQTSSRYLSEAIRAVHKGLSFFSPAVAKRVGRQQRTALDRQGRLKAKDVRLSAREMEVLQQVAEGAANKQIAAALSICVKTVEKHRSNLMQKLGIHDTAGLTRYAIAEGVIESSVQLTII
jgi:DNA-binding NarL/FixJ family response regulator